MSLHDDRFQELCAGQALGTLNEDERWELDELLATASPEQLQAHRELDEAALHLAAGADLVEPSPAVRKAILEAVREDKRQARPRALHLAAAILTVVSIGLAFYAASLSRSLGEERLHAVRLGEDLQHKDRLLQVLRSNQMEIVVLEGLELNPEGHGKLMWAPENQVAVLQVANLPPAPEDQIYQLWVFVHEGDPTSAGVFVMEEPGTDAFFRFEGFSPVDRRAMRGLLITLEPKGGSSKPSESWFMGARIES